jgi:hypothetical protein
MPSSTFFQARLQGGADLLRLFDVFGLAAQGLGHLVIARVAEITAGLVVFGVGAPAAVKADYAQSSNLCLIVVSSSPWR